MEERYEMNNNDKSNNGRDAMELWSHNRRKEEQTCGVWSGRIGNRRVRRNEHEPIDTSNVVFARVCGAQTDTVSDRIDNRPHRE